MIPKIIHFCWLSNDDFPPLIAKTMATWKEKLPDYEFVHWDTNRFDLESNTWVKQAFESKKYAFAADYIRLYAVYHYGGIYLDTDVEVLKSFNNLIERPYIAGAEIEGVIEAGVFGAEKHMPWVKQCLDYYDGKTFINPDNTFNTLTLPRIMMQQITKTYTVKELPPEEVEINEQIQNNDTLYLFPKDYFCAKNHGTGQLENTKNTYTIHHFAMSWVSKNHTFLPNLKRKLMTVLGVGFVNNLIKLLGLKKIRQFLSKK